MTFIVLVTCLAHLKACPIPGGYKMEAKVNSKIECVKGARDVISSLGYAVADFTISCREK